MDRGGVAKRSPRSLTELVDVRDFLEEVRLRPGMWVQGGSLRHLESMLVGYRVALGVHRVAEVWQFWSPGDQGSFAAWLWGRLGRSSSVGWAVEIEREAVSLGVPSLELFFALWDDYLAASEQFDG